ncbi:MAG: hypothetical protein NC182_01815 [Prevotella sp.]|nr:hypothetical protein [Staphylococcus sp.]MCM1349920.1 hypothetical protein [Prevotella sp.]
MDWEKGSINETIATQNISVNKIKILNLEFEIREVECISHGGSQIGEINHIDQVILLKKGLSEERKKIVLLHEILHSIFEQLGFAEEHDNEHLIDSLASSIYQILNDNKTIF